MICYVCNRPITDKEASQYIPGGLRRHQECQAGSSSWLSSEVAKASSIYKHYKKEVNDARVEG